MARPFSFEIHPIFVPNSREKALILARDFGQELFFFRIDFFDGRRSRRRRRGWIAVTVVVAAATGRRAGKKGHLFTLWLTIPQRRHVLFFSFPLWWPEKPILFFASPFS